MIAVKVPVVKSDVDAAQRVNGGRALAVALAQLVARHRHGGRAPSRSSLFVTLHGPHCPNAHPESLDNVCVANG